MSDRYVPPYRITPGILHSIEQIGEALGSLRLHSDSAIASHLAARQPHQNHSGLPGH